MGSFDVSESRHRCPVDSLAGSICSRRTPFFFNESTRWFLAPDFTFDTLDGNKVTLSELCGKVSRSIFGQRGAHPAARKRLRWKGLMSSTKTQAESYSV